MQLRFFRSLMIALGAFSLALPSGAAFGDGTVKWIDPLPNSLLKNSAVSLVDHELVQQRTSSRSALLATSPHTPDMATGKQRATVRMPLQKFGAVR